MKKCLAFVLCFVMLAAMLPAVQPHAAQADGRYLEINETNFPDAEFRDWIVNNLDVSGNASGGYYMTEAQAAAVTVIECGTGEIASLRGVEHFPNLEELYCDPFTFSESGALTSVDLSANIKLKVVDLACNQLGSIDVTMLKDLEDLSVGFTGVSTLDVTQNTKLARLTINATNLTAVDLSHNPLLDWLDLCDSPIQKIDISGCPNMMAYYRAGERELDLPYLAGKHVYGPGDESVLYNLAFSDGTTVKTVTVHATAVCGETPVGDVAVSPEDIIFPGEQFTLTAPDAEGYAFAGWYGYFVNWLGDEYYDFITDTKVYTASTEKEEVTYVAEYSVTSGECGDGVYWTFDESTGTLTIYGTGEISNTMGWFDLQYVIRRVVVGDGVTCIPGSAFDLLPNLVSAHIGRSVAEIGWNPFAWSHNLQEITVDPNNSSFRVTDGVLFSMDGTELYAYPPQKDGSSYVIPDSVTWIKGNAFCAARKLTSVTIPNSVTIIDGWSFSQSGLTSVIIPESVTDVYGEAFNACTSLETVIVHGKDTNLWADGDGCEGVFENCPNLRSVTMPCSISPGEHTFRGCYSLEELHLTVGSGEINPYMIEDLLFWYHYTEFYYWNEETQSWEDGELPAAKPLSVILDEGIASIPEGAFDTNYFDVDDYEGNSAIASVTLPASITEIGENAFADCGNLKDVYYGSTEEQKENIDIAAGNEDLLNAEWHFTTEAYSGQCGDEVYWSFDPSTGTLTITGSGEMWNFGIYADLVPWRFLPIRSIEIQDGVTSIGTYAFYRCDRLSSVSLPNGLQSIGYSAFENCFVLGAIELPDSVTTVGLCAFKNCTELSEISIGSGITDIYGVGNSLYSTFEETAWLNAQADGPICLGYILLGYKGTYPESVNVEEGTTVIARNAFFQKEIKTAVLPDSVRYIGVGAFKHCEELTSVSLGNGVVSIGSEAFYGNKSLTEITIPDSVTNLEKECFWGCESLASVTLPNTLTVIENGMFIGCTSLTEFTVPDSVTVIKEEAFRVCTGLATIRLGSGIAEIAGYAFTRCDSLSDVYYNGTRSDRELHLTIDNAIGWNADLINATWHYLIEAVSGKVEWNAEDVKFKGATPYVIANGSAQTPRFTVKNQYDLVIDPEFYDYEYKENTAAGTGYVFVTFKGDYEGVCRGSFKIYLQPTTTTTVANVKDGIKLSWSKVAGADGYVIYRRAWSSTTNGWTDFVRWNNTKELNWLDTKVYAGTRYQYGIKAYFNKRLDPVTNTWIGGNTGDNFNLGEVGPLKTTVRITTRTLNSVTAGKKQMTVKWAGSSNFTGYQVQYATNAAFTQNAKAIKITNPKTVQTVIKSLTSGKTYYVRVRSYHEFNGMTYFGGWSNVKSCKVK